MSPPSNYEWNQMIKIYAVTSTILLLKFIFSMTYALDQTQHPDEDIKAFSYHPPVPDDIKRRLRIAGNDIENIPVHFGIFILAFVIQNILNFSGTNGEEGTLALSVLIVAYTGLRIAHTLCYLFKLQPFRSISYVLSIFTIFTTAAILIYSAFQIDVTNFK